jgi:hypothetical protein
LHLDEVEASDHLGECVYLALPDVTAALAAVRDIEPLASARKFALDSVLVEQMAAPGVELVIGGLIDTRFGPVVVLALAASIDPRFVTRCGPFRSSGCDAFHLVVGRSPGVVDRGP